MDANHCPLRICVGVTILGEDQMWVEIEASAHDPEGAMEVFDE